MAGGDYRPLRPAPSSDSSSPSGSQTPSISALQSGPTTPGVNPPRAKRQQIGVACSACQRRKTKCDGQRPNCSMCERKRTQCIYDSEGDQRRTENLKRSNLALTERVDDFRFLVDFLQQASDIEAAEVLRRIRTSDNVEETVKFIKDSSLLLQATTATASTYQNKESFPRDGESRDRNRANLASTPPVESSSRTASPYGEPPMRFPLEQLSKLDSPQRRGRQNPDWLMSTYGSGEPTDRPKEPKESIGVSAAKQARRMEHLQLPSINSLVNFEEPPISCKAHPWTKVTKDNKLVSHLVSLYFTWEHGHHRVVEKSALLRDMGAADKNDSLDHPPSFTFCSSLLVNALLSASCHLYFSSGGGHVFDNMKEYGRRFFQEAERLLELEGDRSCLTTLQALYLMLYYSFLQGRTTLGSKYRRAIHDMYIRLDLGQITRKPAGYDEDENKQDEWGMLSQTIWGLYCTDAIYALSCGWLPLVTKRPSIERTFEAPTPETEDLWQPYPLLRDKQPSMLHEVLSVSLDIIDIIRDVLEYSHSKISEPELGRAASLYKRLLEWKGSLPDKLLSSFSTLPCILLLHVQYNAAIICLLRAFLDNTSGGEDLLGEHPRNLCLSHAIDAMSTVWIFRAMYGLGVSHSMLACISSGFSLVFYLTPGDLRSEAFLRACIALHEMSDRFPPCGDMLLGLRALVNRYQIYLPPHCAQYLMQVTAESRVSDCDVLVPARIPKHYRIGDDEVEGGAWLGGIDELLRSVNLSVG